ncbi:MAG: hypothetical protein ACLFM1_03905 [Bacteroidales bacterium]
MNKKRSTILLLLTSLIVFPLLTGCFGVGEDDPFISLRTRKARIVGEWDIDTYRKDVIQNVDDIERIKVETTVEGEDYEMVKTWLGTERDTVIEAEVLDYAITFDKNGYFDYIFEYEIRVDIVDEETFETTSITETIKDEMSGTWNFLGRIDDYSNKERLSLVILNETNTHITVTQITSDDEEEEPEESTDREVIVSRYANGEMSTIWEINMLKFKEIDLYQDINSVNVETGTTPENGTFTYTEVGYQQQGLIRTGKDADAAPED